jgi:iron complex outermembrane receptor protein
MKTILWGTIGLVTANAAAQDVGIDREWTRIDTVVVIGERDRRTSTELAGSLDVIGRAELEYEHVDDTMELFTKVPGVYFTRFNQGIINTDVAIRGFGSDGASPHAKLLIDGIPANLHSGYAELDQLFPLAIDRVEVFKGTSDPRYGLYNIAGSYSVDTRADTDAQELEATFGSYAARELQAYVGDRRGNFSQSYFAGIRDSDGYRDHTSVEKFSASGRWSYDVSEDTSLGLIARTAGYEGDAPGYLTREEARHRPRDSAGYANQDGGEKTSDHVSLHLDTQAMEDVDWQLKAYWQTFERERWVRFSADAALQNRFDDERQMGAISTLRWAFSDEWRLNWGIDVERQRVIEQRFGTTGQSRRRDSANVLRNRHYDFETRGSYVQIEHAPSKLVSWNAAVRVDRIDGTFHQRNSAGARSDLDIYRFGSIVQPKANFFIAPSDRLTLFANVGRSFQHPFGIDAFTVGSRTARDVSINDGWESGFHWTSPHGWSARISYWQQRARDEFVSVDGTARNVGKTDREGFDVAGTWTLNDQFALWANYTTVDSSIERPSDSQLALAGNSLRTIPDYTASAGMSYSLTQALTVRLHVDSQGDYYVNEANVGGRFGGYTLVNTSFDYRTLWGSVSLQINNLTDEFYEYVFDFSEDGTQTIHSPGDGLNASLSVGIKF